MKKLILITIVVSEVIFGCSKEDLNKPVPTSTTSQSTKYMPLSIGNYWVYDTYVINTLGNENLAYQADSAYVRKDTVINNKTYYIVEGGFSSLLALGGRILRNENSSVIESDGSIIFTTINLGSVYKSDSIGGLFTTETWITPQLVNVTTTLGNSLCFDKKTEITPIQSNYPWGIRISHTYYNEQVGALINQFYFASSPNLYESRLVRYKIN